MNHQQNLIGETLEVRNRVLETSDEDLGEGKFIGIFILLVESMYKDLISLEDVNQNIENSIDLNTIIYDDLEESIKWGYNQLSKNVDINYELDDVNLNRMEKAFILIHDAVKNGQVNHRELVSDALDCFENPYFEEVYEIYLENEY